MHSQTYIAIHIQRTKVIDTCICVLLLVPFFEPKGLTSLFEINWDYVWIVGFAFLLLLTFPSIKQMNKAFFIYASFYLSILLSTWINGRDLFPAFALAGKMISFILLFNYYARFHKLQCLIQTMKAYMGIMVLITVIIQFLQKDVFGFTLAHNTINFLDSDNFLGYYYISFILLVYLADQGKNKHFQTFDLIFWVSICILSLVNAWAATCLIIFILFSVFLLFKKWRIFRFLTPLTSLIVNAVFTILLVGFQIQKYFKWLIVDILKKNLTLSRRTYIWQTAITNILNKPIFGYGTTQGGRLEINHYSVGLRSYTNFSHNVFLEILIQGGIVAMIFFVIIYIGANQRIQNKKTHTEMKTMICISLFSILLMQFSEFAIYMPIANLPLILCFFYKDLVDEGFERPQKE